MVIDNAKCAYCSASIHIKPSRLGKTKSGLHFCSAAHAALGSRTENGLFRVGQAPAEGSIGRAAQRAQLVVKCLGCPREQRVTRFTNGYCKQCSYIQRWLAGEETGTTPNNEIVETVRIYIRNLKGEQCWECGWNEVNIYSGKIPVQVDHIDGNSGNNKFENLQLLCPNHHSLTSTFGNLSSRTVKSGRIKRYKKL